MFDSNDHLGPIEMNLKDKSETWKYQKYLCTAHNVLWRLSRSVLLAETRQNFFSRVSQYYYHHFFSLPLKS